jgi:hypothetical protein
MGTMPTLAIVADKAILIYYADHEPAHFLHIRSANFRAKMAISDLAVIEVSGRMKSVEINAIRRWARAH